MDKKQLKKPVTTAAAKVAKKPTAVAGKPASRPAGAAPKPKKKHRFGPILLLLLAIVSGTVSVYSLRANNLRMVELRQAVYDADKSGKDLEPALRNLREHVYGHMNTSLSSGANAVYPPIQLKYTYERLSKAEVDKEKAAQANASAQGGAVYTDAQKYCEKTIPNGVSGKFRLDCIQKYVKEHPADTSSVVAPTIKSIPKNLYQFDFVSPWWSPDMAGWSMLVSVASLLSAMVLWLYRLFTKKIK